MPEKEQLSVLRSLSQGGLTFAEEHHGQPILESLQTNGGKSGEPWVWLYCPPSTLSGPAEPATHWTSHLQEQEKDAQGQLSHLRDFFAFQSRLPFPENSSGQACSVPHWDAQPADHLEASTC